MRFEVHPVNPQSRIVKLAAAALEDVFEGENEDFAISEIRLLGMEIN